MANYSNLKTAIENAVDWNNGDNEITGQNLLDILETIIDSLGAKYKFADVATPSSSISTPDEPLFYLAGAGTYANFSGLTVSVQRGTLAIFYYDTAWHWTSVRTDSDAFFNVNQYLEAPSTTYTKATGRNAVPAALRSKGMIITYLTTNGWIIEQNLSTSGTWNADANWQTIGPVSVSQNTETGDNIINIGSVANPFPNDSQLFYKRIGVPTNDKRSFIFDGVRLRPGHLYYVMQVGGYRYELATSNNDIVEIQQNNIWYEFTPELAVPFVYAGNTDGKENPQIIFADSDGIYGQLLREFISRVNENFTTLFANDSNVKFELANANDVFLQKTASAQYTSDGTGIEIPAGNTGSNYIGFKTSALNSILSKVYGKTIHTRTVYKLSGDDFQNIKFDGFENYQAFVTISNVKKSIVGNYMIVDCDMTFPSSGTIPTDSQCYSTVRGTNNQYNVTINYVCSLYELNDTIIAQFGDAAYLEQLTYGIREVARQAQKVETVTINVSRDGMSTTGRTIHFSGLTAISDAINSITDASEFKRYILHVEGIFVFTNPLDVPMLAGGEYSIIAKKDYIDIEGDGPDKSIVIMDFPANATFHSGKAYSDYQPIYFFGAGGTIRGMSIIGKNCRYGFHIESAGASSANKTINIDNCDIRYLGHPDYSGDYGDGMGTGIASGQVWNITNTLITYTSGFAFAIHTPLEKFQTIPVVNFVNCIFNGNISLHNYQLENNVLINVNDCSFANKIGTIEMPHYVARPQSKTADYTRILLRGNNIDAIFRTSGFITGASTPRLRGGALRVKSASTGATSIVSFDVSSSAFDVIVGKSSEPAEITTIYGWNQHYGYVYRNGGTGLSGQAFGTLDVSANGTNNLSLGKRLGNCSTTNKTLGIYVDGTLYNVVFNQDYTNVSNADIVAVINAVLGDNAEADIFSPAMLYYPEINGLKYVYCVDNGSIKRGMGVVFEYNGMRKAKNTDGCIDGICLDDTANGQYGRVITRGYIFPQRFREMDYCHDYFTSLDNNTSWVYGKSAGISTTQDGVFDENASPKLLVLKTGGLNLTCWEIKK